MRNLSEDLYPSRVGDAPRFIERREPVVYGSEADGPLTADQLKAFERDGFLILKRFYRPDEVAAHREELDRLRHDRRLKARPEAIVEPDSNELRSLFWVHHLSPHYAQVASSERVAGMARQILGSDVYVHQSRVNLKPGFAGRDFHWHSDFETWHVEDGLPRMRAVSCSILLTPNYSYNGPLMFIPGSHRYYVACEGETPEEHYRQSLRRQEFGVPDSESLRRLAEEGGIVPATGEAGTLILFDCNTMHGSSTNITPFPRSNLFFVFNSVANRVTEPFGGQSPRPEFVASRRYTEPV